MNCHTDGSRVTTTHEHKHTYGRTRVYIYVLYMYDVHYIYIYGHVRIQGAEEKSRAGHSLGAIVEKKRKYKRARENGERLSSPPFPSISLGVSGGGKSERSVLSRSRKRSHGVSVVSGKRASRSLKMMGEAIVYIRVALLYVCKNFLFVG